MNKISRIRTEKQTINAMIKLYCKNNHNTQNQLCNVCLQLLEYSFLKIEKCAFLPDKPNCKNCKVHCYKPDLREKIRKVMRYSGPKMFFHHPYLTLLYMINNFKDKFRKH